MKKNVIIVVAFGIVIFAISPEANAQWVQTAGMGIQVVRSFASWGSMLLAGCQGGFNGSTGYVGGAFRSTDNGASWVAIDSGFVYSISVYSLAMKGPNLFAGTSNGVFVSSDSGSNWKESSAGLPGWISSSSGTWNMEVPSVLVVGSRILVGTAGGGIYYSSDSGNTWIPHNSGFTGNDVSHLWASGSRIFAGSWTEGAFVSTDTGSSWTQAPTNATCFANSDHYLYGGNEYGGPYRSSDNGTSWVSCDSGLTAFDVQCLASHGSNVFAGTMVGVFLSTNDGVSWNKVNSGFTESITFSPDIHAVTIREDYVFAGAGGRGCWRRPLSDFVTTVPNDRSQVPGVFNLEQNYPNPFNPSTTIRYALPQRSHVILSLYNTLGQHVATLKNGEEQAGYHEVAFDGSKLASGVYIYRLQAGTYVGMKRLLLLR